MRGGGGCEEALLISCHSHSPSPHPYTPTVCCALLVRRRRPPRTTPTDSDMFSLQTALKWGEGEGRGGFCSFLLTSHSACLPPSSPSPPDCQWALERHTDQNLGAVSSRMLSLRLFCFELHFTLPAASCLGPTAETRRFTAAT